MTTLSETILKEIDDRRNDLSSALARNQVKDIEEYRFICGEVRGLTAVSTYVRELVKRMEYTDD